jgi:hypothetical protein
MSLSYEQKALSQASSGDGIFGVAAAAAVGSGSRPA